MAAPRDDGRRSVVPHAAGRSLWLAAAWTGVGAAVVCATLGIVAVAICWLPVAGAQANPVSAIRAGLLTFLAALHGGVTIDATSAQFAPLGLTVIVGLAAWRAGAGLGDAASALGERDPARLVIAAALQAASFTVAALTMVPFAHLGTSSAPVVGVGAGALLLFLGVGGAAFVRASALRDWYGEHVPAFVGTATRVATVVIAVYLASGAVLAGGSLVLHGARVEELSRQVGGGWGSVPVLLLGVLAAPNAAIAGAAYLSGAGFTVGSGSTVGPFTSAHGVLPAFPVLGAVPDGHGAPWFVWLLVFATALTAGTCAARMVARVEGWRSRLRNVTLAVLLVAAGWAVLSWQGGGGIGAGRLRVMGASWWQVGGLVAAEVGVTAGTALAVAAAWRLVRARDGIAGSGGWSSRADTVVIPGGRSGDAAPAAGRRLSAVSADAEGKPDEAGKLAG